MLISKDRDEHVHNLSMQSPLSNHTIEHMNGWKYNLNFTKMSFVQLELS